MADNAFTSEHTVVLAATPERAFQAFADEVDKWWDASHSFAGDASAFAIEAYAGGCFCERSESVSVAHMQVVNVRTGQSLTMLGGLGPLQALPVNGVMRFEFTDHAAGAVLHYHYAVSGVVAGGLAQWAEPVDRVQLGQLQRLQQYLASGEPLND